MSTTMAVDDVKRTLPELLEWLAPGDEVTRTTVRGTFSGSLWPLAVAGQPELAASSPPRAASRVYPVG